MDTCGGQSKRVKNLHGQETSLFPWMSMCNSFFGEEVDGPEGHEDMSSLNSQSSLQHSVGVEQAAERCDAMIACQ